MLNESKFYSEGGKIRVFNFVSVDGYFAGPNGEIDWFKVIVNDDEWDR